MNALALLPTLLALSLAQAPAQQPAVPPPDDVARAQAEALLGTIDRPVHPDRFRALGPVAADVLAATAASPDAMPSRRSNAILALATVDPARAETVARALVDAAEAPRGVRQSAVQALGRVLPPARLAAALEPVLRAAPDAGLRATAAETLARHAPALSCAGVLEQAASEDPRERPAFERAAALCAGR